MDDLIYIYYYMKKSELKALIREILEETAAMDQDWFKGQKMIKDDVELNPERQQDMIEYQLTAIEEKCKRIKEIMANETVKLDPWMIDKVSIAFHNIDVIANKFMFGDKAD